MTAKNKHYFSLTSIVLVFSIAFIAVTVPIVKAAKNIIYVEDIKIYECEDDDNAVANAKNWFESQGYVFSGINLNDGTSTDENAYLGYKTTNNKDLAITDIRLMAMDTGYTIYNYEDMMNYIASKKSGTAQTLQNAAVLFAENYRLGSPKAKDAYKGLNLFNVGDENKTKLGDYILSGKTDVQFFTKMLMKSSTGTLNAVHGFLSNGIAPYKNDIDSNGKIITTNWAEFTVKSELWNKIDSDDFSTDELNNLHKEYNDSARELFKTVQDFTTYYENAKARESQANELPEGDTMEKAAEQMENIEREDSDFLYLAAFEMLNKYEFETGEKLGDWFITLGKKNSDKVDLMELYPVVEAMGKCQASIANTGGFVSAVLNLADNEHNKDFEDAVENAKDKIGDLLNEESFSIWENCDGDLENSTIAFTSDALRKSSAENALGKKSNWEKKKEAVKQIEKIVNLAMGIMFVVVPVATFVLSMAVIVTNMMAATCIAMAALNTMCVWLLAAAQFLSACLPYIGMIVLVATITAAIAIWAKEYIMGDKVHIDKQSEKPDIIFDAQERQNETFDIKYKSVRNNLGAVSDINCGSQVYWCLLAYTTDVNAGSPICADDNGVIFRMINGNATGQNGYDCVKFFGERSAGDFNAYCKKNSVNGIYIYYRTEQSITEQNVSPEASKPTYNSSEEINYIADLIVCTGKDPTEAKGKITRRSGKYYVYDYNLSPDCSHVTYIGYSMTTDRKSAVTDIRVAPYVGVSQATDNIFFGEIKYTRIDILGINTTYGDEKTKPQADCLYFTTDSKAGEPILANGLHAVTSASQIKNGWEPVSVFSGMPYDFNTALIDDDYADPTAIAWLNDRVITTVSGYKGENDESEVLNNHRYVHLYTQSDNMYTSGTKYLSGLFLIGGYDCFDNSWTHSDDEEYAQKFKDDYVKKQYRTGVCDTNLLASLSVAKYVCWNNMQSYLCYTWSYSPKRALYNIEAYQGDNYSTNLNYTMTKVNDSGISQNYVSATCLYQQCFGLGNARFIRPSNNYVNAFGSGLGIYNFEKCIYDDGYTYTLPENVTCGYDKIQFLPTGLYVTGYASGQRALTLDDVVFSTKSYVADGADGRISVTLSGEKTLTGNTPQGVFHAVTDMKNPRSLKPFNLSTPDYYYSGKYRASGTEFYIYLSGSKLSKRRYISSLSIGAFSREQYKTSNPKATDNELKAIDSIVEGTAMSAATGSCSDEVIIFNIATDNQSKTWYNHENGGIAVNEAPENKPAAYIGVSRTDAGVSNDDGESNKQKPITGVLFYKLDDTTAPSEIEVDSVKYTCAAVSTPIVMKGVKYFLYYSYSKGALPGEPIEEIAIDSIPIISGYATNVCADKNSKEPYGNPEQTNYIHLKYEHDPRSDFFNKIYIGRGDTARAAQCDLLSNGCLEYLDMDANNGVAGHSVYIGFRRGRLDWDKINKKKTEAKKEDELKTQLKEAIYDVIITDDEPFCADGIVRNNIYYYPVCKKDLTDGMGHKLYMYFASPWYSNRYNTNTGASTLLPQDVFTGYLSHFAMSQYDRVPYNSSLVGTADDTQNSIKAWEYVVLSDGSRAADLNEGTVAFKVESSTAHYAYDNRITMFVQRSDGSVKPAGEITGGFVDKVMAVGSAYINS